MSGPISMEKYRMNPVRQTVNERLTQNENITRKRIHAVEEHLTVVGQYLQGTQDFFNQGLWKRFKWLIFGFYWENRALKRAQQKPEQDVIPETKGKE